jgi:hypothetical protein
MPIALQQIIFTLKLPRSGGIPSHRPFAAYIDPQ